VNYGPKEKRAALSFAGRIIWEAYRNGGVLTDLGNVIGECIDSLVRGFPEELEPEELEKIKKEGLIL